MTNIKKDLANSIKKTLSEFNNDTEKYLNSFNIESQMSFSNNEETRKKLLRNYKRFLIVIRKHTDELNTVAAKLSSHICSSDNQCNKELTEQLINMFNNHEIFQNAIIKFMSNCDTLFLDSEQSLNQTQIINNSRELLSAINNYKQSI